MAKKKTAWLQYIGLMFNIIIGAVCGVLMVEYTAFIFAKQLPLWKELLCLFVVFVIICAALFVQIIIHEAGHLVFGKLSGYEFSSFRVMSFMWVKENGKTSFKRLSIAGTGGQCLMVPPAMEDGKIPVLLYNMGGSLMNVLAALVFLALYFFAPKNTFLSAALILLVIVGLAFAVINGVPMRYGTVDNDAYNALALGKDKNAMRAFWVQLSISAEGAKGARLKDMPCEWFEIPSDEKMNNSMIAATGVFACNRLMDQHSFDEAARLIDHFLNIDSKIVDLHRGLLVCDRLFCELIGSNQQETVEALLAKKQKRFMKTMKNFPTVLRTQYAYFLLAKKDEGMAKKVKAQFVKCAKSYPYQSDIQSEQELIEIAKAKLFEVTQRD